MFEFKSMAKSMSRESAKAESRSKALTEKVKKCIAKGDYEQAKIAASDAIREKNMIKRYRILSSKVDTIAQRLQSAYQNQRLTEQMQKLTQQLIGAGNMMDIVKMTETMSNFEKMFDDIEVTTTIQDDVLNNITAGTVNETEVNQLIQQVAEQNGMKLSEEFDGIKIGEEGTEIKEQQPVQQIAADGFPRV